MLVRAFPYHDQEKGEYGDEMGYIAPSSFFTKNKKKIYFRTAEDKDAAAMHALTKSVIEEENGLIMTIHDFLLTIEDQIHRNQIFLQHPKTIAMVAFHHETLIGILTIEPEHLLKTCHRGNVGIIIHEHYRSEGVGKKLMELAIQWAKSNHVYEKLQLDVLETNIRAVKLYEKLGFFHEGKIENAVKHKEGVYENVLTMGLFLH